MQRRNFLQSSGLLAAIALHTHSFGLISGQKTNDDVKHFHLPALPPLDHKGGMDIRVWVNSNLTNGLYSSVECAVAPKTMGPAPHAHRELDELMYVAEGTAHVLVNDEVVEIKAGGWHMRPRLIKHTFWNASSDSLRFYDMYFNQPFEEYLEAIFHQLTPENGFPHGSEQKMKEIKRLNEKFGLIRFDNSEEEKQSIIKTYGLK